MGRATGSISSARAVALTGWLLVSVAAGGCGSDDGSQLYAPQQSGDDGNQPPSSETGGRSSAAGTGGSLGVAPEPSRGTGGASSTGGVSSSTGGVSQGGKASIPASSGGASFVPPDEGASGDASSADGGSSGDEEDPEDTPDDQGDDFEAPGTNPFVMAAHDPLSTFGADADTASYDLFRRDVNLGFLPDPASVRLEEWVNNFVYDYPAVPADAEHPFGIVLGAAPSLFEDETLMLRVGIQGLVPPEDQKKPANLVFLVDVSGSMDSVDKAPLVRQVLTQALDVVAPTDTISIVTYASSTEVRLTPTPVADRDAIEAVIAGLIPGGSTAGGQGLMLAYDQARAGFLEGGINHILICTDGDFNVGPSSTEELLGIVTEERQSGVTLTMLGFGIGNLNDAMMEAVSNAGNGIYGVISNSDQAYEYVHQRLLSTLVHIAKDMKIQVEFNPERVLAYRLLGYENRAIADGDFRDDAVDAGEIGAGHRVTALYQLVLAGGALPMSSRAPEPEDGTAYDGELEVRADELVLVKVRYKQPGASEEDAATEVGASLVPEDVAGAASELDTDFRWALAIASFAEIVKESPYANPLRLGAIDEIVHDPAHATRSDRVEFVQLFELASELGLGQP